MSVIARALAANLQIFQERVLLEAVVSRAELATKI